MVFHGGPSDRKIPQVSKTFLSIIADLNNTLVWVVSSLPLISSNSSSLLAKSLGTAPSAPTTIGITVTLMLHSLFSSLVQEILYVFVFFYFHSVVSCKGQIPLDGEVFCYFFSSGRD